MDCGTKRVVRIEYGLDRTTVDLRLGDRIRDALARHVGQLLIHKLSGIGVTLADKATIEPLLGDALELSEEMKLRFVAWIAPLCVEEPLGEMKEKCRAPEVTGVNQIEVHALTDNPLDRCARRSDQIGRQLQH